jgi:integrase
MKATETRFKISPFINKLTGSQSWRVSGTKRNGERIRENFARENDARNKQVELEAEFLQGQTETMLRSTKLTEPQIRVAESIFTLLPDAEQVRDRFMRFLQNGLATATAPVGAAPLIDDAFKDFEKWLDGEPDASGNNICKLREPSKLALRSRVGAFKSGMGKVRLDEITPDMIENFLGNLKNAGNKLNARTVINYKLNVSRFFTWCIARPRKWVAMNPCKEIKLERDEKGAIQILSVEQVEKLLQAAEKGNLAVYTALAVFGGLRPAEIARLTWEQINLTDKEIHLESKQTKTKRSRTIQICPTLLAWLTAYKGEEIYPAGWIKRFRKVRMAAGIVNWIPDCARHTAISHYFRHTGSYGKAAEKFGNSEQIIKDHYQGRVTSDETKLFYAIKPAAKK